MAILVPAVLIPVTYDPLYQYKTNDYGTDWFHIGRNEEIGFDDDRSVINEDVDLNGEKEQDQFGQSVALSDDGLVLAVGFLGTADGRNGKEGLRCMNW